MDPPPMRRLHAWASAGGEGVWRTWRLATGSEALRSGGRIGKLSIDVHHSVIQAGIGILVCDLWKRIGIRLLRNNRQGGHNSGRSES